MPSHELSRTSHRTTSFSDTREGAVAAPDNFDADAEQDEGRQPHQYIGARLTQRSDGAFGKSVTEIYSRCDGDDSRDGRTAEDR